MFSKTTPHTCHYKVILPSVTDEYAEESKHKVADVAVQVVEGCEGDERRVPWEAAQAVEVTQVMVATEVQQLHQQQQLQFINLITPTR